jgi:glycosyltransferase involved in cell wall biosynthesis
MIWDWGRRGGGPLMTLLLARRLIDQGYGSDIALSLSEQNELIAEFRAMDVTLSSVETFVERPSVRRLLRQSAPLAWEFRRQLAQYQPAVLLIPMLFGATIPLVALARSVARRIIYVVHDAQAHSGERIGLQQSLAQFVLLRTADTLVTVSQNTKSELARLHPRMESKLVAESLVGLYDSVRNVRDIPAGRRWRLLAPGRLVRYKGFDRLAQALEIIGDADYELTIVGQGPEEARVAKLFAQWPQVRIESGWTSMQERRRLYESHDVLLCPHDEASQSGLICEALVHAMPSIVTPVGALPEQIGFGKAGWVTTDMSPQALAQQIENILQGSSDYRAASAGCAEVLNQARSASTWSRTLELG